MQKFSLQPDSAATKDHQDQHKGSYNPPNPINPVAIVAAKYGLNPLSIKRHTLEGMTSPVMPPGGVPMNKLISPSFETTTRPSEKLTSSCHKTLLGAAEGRFTSPSFQGAARAPESRFTSPSYQSRPTIGILNPCSTSVKITAAMPGGRFVSPSSQQCRQTQNTPDGRFDSSSPSFPCTTGATKNRLMSPSIENTSSARTQNSKLDYPSPSFEMSTGALRGRPLLRTFDERFISPSVQKTSEITKNKFTSLSIQTAKAQENRVAYPLSLPATTKAFVQTSSSQISSGTPDHRFVVRAPGSTFSSANSQKVGGAQENRFISPSVQVNIGALENNKCTSAPFQSTLGASEKKLSPLADLNNHSRFSWVSPHLKDGSKRAGKTILADSSNMCASKMTSSKVIKELEPNRISLSKVTVGSLNESSKVDGFYCGGTKNSTSEMGSRADLTNASPISPSYASDLTSTMLSSKCMCERCPKVVLCRACGSLMNGRMRMQCPHHPKQIFLMDLTCCCNCQSSNLTEICDSGKTCP